MGPAGGEVESGVMPSPGEFERDYYRTVYRDYGRQNPPRKLAFYRDLIWQNLPAVEQPRILEIGCAFGSFLSSLDGNWRKVGIDASQFALTQAARDDPRGSYLRAVGTALPLSGEFDVIAAFDVIEHINNLDAVAASVRRLLAPGGVFAFVVPVYDGPLGWLVHRLDKDPTHVHKHSRQWWMDWAQQYFSVVERVGVFRYLLPAGPYVHCPARTLYRVAPAIAVVASALREPGALRASRLRRSSGPR